MDIQSPFYVKAARSTGHDERTPVVCSGVHKVMFKVNDPSLMADYKTIKQAQNQGFLVATLWQQHKDDCEPQPAPPKATNRKNEPNSFSYKSIQVIRAGEALIFKLERTKFELCTDTTKSKFFIEFGIDDGSTQRTLASTKDHLFSTVSRRSKINTKRKREMDQESELEQEAKRPRVEQDSTETEQSPPPPLLPSFSPSFSEQGPIETEQFPLPSEQDSIEWDSSEHDFSFRQDSANSSLMDLLVKLYPNQNLYLSSDNPLPYVQEDYSLLTPQEDQDNHILFDHLQTNTDFLTNY